MFVSYLRCCGGCNACHTSMYVNLFVNTCTFWKVTLQANISHNLFIYILLSHMEEKQEIKRSKDNNNNNNTQQTITFSLDGFNGGTIDDDI